MLYLEALRLDSNCALAYAAVASAVLTSSSSGESRISLSEFGEFSPMELLLKSLEMDPYSAFALNNLACLATPTKPICFSDGKKASGKDLLLRAVQLEPLSASLYNNLAGWVEAGEHVPVNGVRMSKKDLFLRAIDVGPHDFSPYYGLANALSIEPGAKTATLLDGRVFTIQGLYLKAIELCPTYSNAYINVAETMEDSQKVCLPGGVEMSRGDLYLKAIDLDPRNGLAYNNLASISLGSHSLTLLSGEVVTVHDLFLRALHFGPLTSLSEIPILYELAEAVPFNDTTKLLNGSEFSELDFYLRAIQLDSKSAYAFKKVSSLLSSGGSVVIPGGARLNKLELFYRFWSLTVGAPLGNVYKNTCKYIENG